MASNGIGRFYLQRLLALTLTFVSPLVCAAEEAARVPEEIIVTASLTDEPAFLALYSVDAIRSQRIRMANFRSTPDIFREIPGTLVQKTAHGQGSPYIRGFTGYRNLFMIDGIRLNNAVFRDGPNQYWATVDSGAIRQLEVVRGPKSVLYGSDAIGGTVNALMRSPVALYGDRSISGGFRYRYGHGEDSHIVGAHLDAALGSQVGLLLGGSLKEFGDIRSGGGTLPNTGYDEQTFDGKLLWQLNENTRLTAAHSRVHQDDVPRTHKTVFSRPFAGTTVGSELQRDLDHDRKLSYLRLESDRALGWQDWRLTVFHHRQEERRERLRSRNRQDSQGVEVDTIGVSIASSRETRSIGLLTAGVEWARDRVDSWSSRNPVQGPVADDSSYDWAGLFLQDRYAFNEAFELIAGIRLSYFRADAGRISDPVDGSAYSYSQSWTEPVGNLRFGWTPVADRWRMYGGISQGFRAPNLSDLTRFDSARSNEFEIPATGLEPERYVQYEIGARFQSAGLSLEAAAYYTDIEDQIQRLLTGRINEDGEYEVTKANVGDGELYGVELQADWLFGEQWLAFGHFSWLDGDITTEAVAGAPPVIDHHSRMMPTNLRLGLRYYGAGPRNWWAESEVIVVEKADRLSLRDQGDTQRIPPGGTPGYTLWHVRAGFDIGENWQFNLALENLLDEDYRVHGSGQNEAGRNFVVSVDAFF